MQCHYRLQFDADGYPRMYVFAGCKAFIRTIPMLMYDEHKVEDLDTKWRITARTNGGICACRGQSSRRYRQKHRRFCLIPWT